MGLLVDNDDVSVPLAFEIRSESICFMDIERKDKHDKGFEHLTKTKSEHIFCYEDGAVEISKEFVVSILKFFSQRENYKYLDLEPKS